MDKNQTAFPKELRRPSRVFHVTSDGWRYRSSWAFLTFEEMIICEDHVQTSLKVLLRLLKHQLGAFSDRLHTR